MPLDTATLAAPQLLRLDPGAWYDRLRKFAQMRRDKTEADKLSRNLDQAIKAVAADLRAELHGAPAATCADLVVTAKAVAGAAASVTLSDGRTVPWASVTALLIGNMRIEARDVLKLFGGRDGSVSIDVN